MVSHQHSQRHHASVRVISIAGLAAAGWIAMGVVAATPSFAANGNGQGLATAPGQLSKLASTVPTTTVPTTTVPTTTAATVGDPMQAQPLSTADLNPVAPTARPVTARPP
jgi:hypothetical protein